MVWPALLGGAMSGIGSAIGGAQQSDAIRDANKLNAEMTKQGFREARMFAQRGLRWRVHDARKAGIHPLAALGAQVSSPSGAIVGSQANTAAGSAIANMGQDIGS